MGMVLCQELTRIFIDFKKKEWILPTGERSGCPPNSEIPYNGEGDRLH
jgi:hypothetical protein